jgi:tetratricopeptide (TPR) repeat protein
VRSRLAFALILLCLCPASRPEARQGGIDFADLQAAYVKGDYQIVSTRLNSAMAFALLSPSVAIAVKPVPPKPGEKALAWSRQRPAFLLEVAIAASLYSKIDVVPALSAGRLLVMDRPTKLGWNASDDAFERHWHRLAIAVLQRALMPDAEHVYLDTLERRYLTGPAGTKLTQPLDARFVLDRAIADEQLAWQAEFPGATAGPNVRPIAATSTGPSTRLSAVVKPGDKSTLGKLLATAIASSDEAAALPEVANEALIRGAALRIRTSRPADALEVLHRLRANDADRVQLYWAALLEARALHELKRLPEAERAYRETATIWPETPSPATGLALVLFDMNRRADAIAAVAAARATPAADPWWSYMLADARFITRWRDALREMLN